MPLYALDTLAPQLADADRVWLAPDATVCGDVTIGLDCSFWFGAVVRADGERVEIGDRTNIQDGCVLHADPGFPAILGKGVTVGHRAVIHGCIVGDDTLIGMSATILNGAKIGKNCIIGAHALVTANTDIPDNSLVMGAPAKVVKTVADAMAANIRRTADSYVDKAQRYAAGLRLQTQE